MPNPPEFSYLERRLAAELEIARLEIARLKKRIRILERSAMVVRTLRRKGEMANAHEAGSK